MNVFMGITFMDLIYCFVLIILITALSSSISVYLLSHRIVSTEETAIVIDKHIYKLAVLNIFPENNSDSIGTIYNVCLLYENKEYNFDDIILYQKVEIGDTVNVKVKKKYNFYDELKSTLVSIKY